MERVEAHVFEGKKLAKAARSATNRDVAQEFFNRADRREGKNTTVMIDGYAVSKESIGCADWEAVPTLAGKDPRLADQKRAKKAKIEPQSHCQICIDGGDLHICSNCPRAYHFHCLDTESRIKANGWQFSCPQHHCFDCQQGTGDAGGMLYRCRWCERAYCEDCIDFDQTELLGNGLMEYELLGYPEMTQAFYIVCCACKENFIENPNNKKLVDDLAEGIRLEYESRSLDSTRSGSMDMTDATSVETPGVETPIVIDDDDDDDVEYGAPKSRKRKAVLKHEAGSSMKKSRYTVRGRDTAHY